MPAVLAALRDTDSEASTACIYNQWSDHRFIRRMRERRNLDKFNVRNIYAKLPLLL